MKLRLVPVVFALVVPLAACNNSSTSGASPASNSSSSPAPVASSAPSSPTVATSPSPTSPASVASAAPTSPTAASSSSTSETSNWYTYSSKEGNYTAKFPEKPAEEKKSANSQQGSISGAEARYVDQAKQRIYLTGYVDLPVPPGENKSKFDVEKGLDGGRNGMVSSMGATVKSETKITQNGSPGRELTMTLQNGIAAKVRIFINPKNLKAYQAIVATKDGKLDFPEAMTFLNSLTISQ